MLISNGLSNGISSQILTPLSAYKMAAVYSVYYFAVVLSVAEIVEKVRVKENPPYRPVVQDGDAEEAFLDLMRVCWEEIPAFRPNFPIINDSLKKMNKGR